MRDTLDMFKEPSRGRFGDEETSSSELIDIDIVIHHGTPKALRVSIDGNDINGCWLPRSQIEIEHKTPLVNGTDRDGRSVLLGTATVRLKERMAKEKGLL